MATKYNNRIFFDVSCGDKKLTLSNKLKSLSPFYIELKEGVSKSFSLELKVYDSRDNDCLSVNDLDSLLNKNAKVFVTQSNSEVNSKKIRARAFNGVLTSYKTSFIDENLVIYTFFIESNLSNLSVNFINNRFAPQNKINFYYDQNVKSILENVIGNKDKTTFNEDFISKNYEKDFSYHKSLFFIQDHESDQDFLDRLCTYYGINYNCSFNVTLPDELKNDLSIDKFLNEYIDKCTVGENLFCTTNKNVNINDQVYDINFGSSISISPIFAQYNGDSEERYEIRCDYKNASQDLFITRDEGDKYLLTSYETNSLSKEISLELNNSIKKSIDVVLKDSIVHKKLEYGKTSYIDKEVRLRSKNVNNLIDSISTTQIFKNLKNLAFASGKVISLGQNEKYLIVRNSFKFYVDSFNSLSDPTQSMTLAHTSLVKQVGNDLLSNNEIHQSVLTIPLREGDSNLGYLGVLPLLDVNDANYVDKILKTDLGAYVTKKNNNLSDFEAIVCDSNGDYTNNEGKIIVEKHDKSLAYASVCYACVEYEDNGKQQKSVIPVECVFGKEDQKFPVVGQRIIVSRSQGEFVYAKNFKKNTSSDELIVSNNLRNDLLNSAHLGNEQKKDQNFINYEAQKYGIDVTSFTDFKSYLEYLIVEGKISNYVSNICTYNKKSNYLKHFQKIFKVKIYDFLGLKAFYTEDPLGTVVLITENGINKYVDIKQRYKDSNCTIKDNAGIYYKYPDSKPESGWPSSATWYKKNDVTSSVISSYKCDDVLKGVIDSKKFDGEYVSLGDYCGAILDFFKKLAEDPAYDVNHKNLSAALTNAVNYTYSFILSVIYEGTDQCKQYNGVISYVEKLPVNSSYKVKDEILLNSENGYISVDSGSNITINAKNKLVINAKSIEITGTDKIEIKTGGSSAKFEPRTLTLTQDGTKSPFISVWEDTGADAKKKSQILNALTGFCSTSSLVLDGNKGATLNGFNTNIKGMMSATLKDSFGAIVEAKVGGTSVFGMKASVFSRIGHEQKLGLFLDVYKKIVKITKLLTNACVDSDNSEKAFKVFDSIGDLGDATSTSMKIGTDFLTRAEGIKKYAKRGKDEPSAVSYNKGDNYYDNSPNPKGITPFTIAYDGLVSLIKVMDDIESIVVDVILATLSSGVDTLKSIFPNTKFLEDTDAALSDLSYVIVRIAALTKYLTAYVWIFGLKIWSPSDWVVSKIENIPTGFYVEAEKICAVTKSSEAAQNPVAGEDLNIENNEEVNEDRHVNENANENNSSEEIIDADDNSEEIIDADDNSEEIIDADEILDADDNSVEEVD